MSLKQCRLSSKRKKSFSQENLSSKSLSKHFFWYFAIVRLSSLYFYFLRRLSSLLQQRRCFSSKQFRWNLQQTTFWNWFIDFRVWMIFKILFETLKQCFSFLLMRNCYNIDNITAKNFRTAKTCDCQNLSQTSSIYRLQLTSKWKKRDICNI